jgi:hypothetical protein
MGLWAVAFIGSTPVGGPIIGFVGQHAGPRIGLVVGGGAALAAGTLGLGTALRAARRQPLDSTTAAAATFS